MATLKEIAEKAGVSICTVSRYLSKESNLKDKTRIKVEAAIKELNYIPNNVARSLKTHRTNNVAVVVPKINNPYYSEITSGISRVLKQEGYNLFIYEFENGNDDEELVIQTLLENMMAGVVFIGLSGDASFSESASRLREMRVPFVYINRMIDIEGYPMVYPDYYRAGELAAEHLVAQGKNKLALLTKGAGNIKMQQHLAGFADRARSLGCDVLDEAIVTHTDNTESLPPELIQDILDQGIDGTFVANEMTAIQFLKALDRMNISVPERMAVVGFGNSLLSVLSNPELTTIDLQNRQLGMVSAENLLRQIKEEEYALVNKLGVRLIQRETT